MLMERIGEFQFVQSMDKCFTSGIMTYFSIHSFLKIDFCAQSCSKPITYCYALEKLGEETVHQHVGREPSGRGFNAYKLNESKLPFNPLVNSGAISVCSLVGTKDPLSHVFFFHILHFQRFDTINQIWKRLAGGFKVGFDNATYQSERKTADRNFALAYLLKESNVFPEDTNLKETLDLYFQLCSISVDCRALAAISAALANNGVSPLSGEYVF
jgi:glutaminase